MILAVTKRVICNGDFLERIEKIASASPYGIILREKGLTIQQYKELAEECMKICRSHNKTKLIINDNIKVAEELGIKDIQVPVTVFLQHRDECIEKFKTVGVSVHSLNEAQLVEKLGASYIIVGNIYETDSKPGVPPKGLPFLKKISESVRIPVFAIGGIKADRVRDVMKAGADGICVMSDLMVCHDPRRNIIAYREQMIK